MRLFKDFDEIKLALVSEVGVSDWVTVTQERINRFAEATGDDQWIHVDVERAKQELPGDACRPTRKRVRSKIHRAGGGALISASRWHDNGRVTC